MMSSGRSYQNGHGCHDSFIVTSSVGTTPVQSSLSSSPSVIPTFSEGDDVLLKDRNDGLVYLGIAVEIDEISGMCLVRFGDGAERWGRIGKEVKALTAGDDAEEEDDDEVEYDVDPGNHQDIMATNLLGNHDQNGESAPLKPRAKESHDNKKRRSHSKPVTQSQQPRETPAHVLSARKELPYDFDSLLWDENHQRNDKER